MEALEEFDDLLAKTGISLAPLGIRNVALLRSDALRALKILRHGQLPILGGDVYFRRGGRLEVAYANWHADPKPNEDRETYSRRGWDKTETFIQDFPESPGAEVLFAIVIKRKSGRQPD